MNNPKAAVYFRFASVEALDESNIESGYRTAWLFDRRNNAGDEVSRAAQMKAFREKCEASGYTIIGETTVVGDGKMTLPAIQSILSQEKDIHYILSPAIRSLSRRADEAFYAIKYMNQRGVIFKSADSGELTNPKKSLLVHECVDDEIGASDDHGAEEGKLELDNASGGPELSM